MSRFLFWVYAFMACVAFYGWFVTALLLSALSLSDEVTRLTLLAAAWLCLAPQAAPGFWVNFWPRLALYTFAIPTSFAMYYQFNSFVVAALVLAVASFWRAYWLKRCTYSEALLEAGYMSSKTALVLFLMWVNAVPFQAASLFWLGVILYSAVRVPCYYVLARFYRSSPDRAFENTRITLVFDLCGDCMLLLVQPLYLCLLTGIVDSTITVLLPVPYEHPRGWIRAISLFVVAMIKEKQSEPLLYYFTLGFLIVIWHFFSVLAWLVQLYVQKLQCKRYTALARPLTAAWPPAQLRRAAQLQVKDVVYWISYTLGSGYLAWGLLLPLN